MFMKLYDETNLRSVSISLPLGNVDDGSRLFECVAMFNKCRSFFCARLSTNTSCKCTRVTRCKSEVQDSYPEKRRVSTEKSESRQKKILSWDPFFEDNDIVKSVEPTASRWDDVYDVQVRGRDSRKITVLFREFSYMIV